MYRLTIKLVHVLFLFICMLIFYLFTFKSSPGSVWYVVRWFVRLQYRKDSHKKGYKNEIKFLIYICTPMIQSSCRNISALCIRPFRLNSELTET